MHSHHAGIDSHHAIFTNKCKQILQGPVPVQKNSTRALSSAFAACRHWLSSCCLHQPAWTTPFWKILTIFQQPSQSLEVQHSCSRVPRSMCLIPCANGLPVCPDEVCGVFTSLLYSGQLGISCSASCLGLWRPLGQCLGRLQAVLSWSTGEMLLTVIIIIDHHNQVWYYGLS